MILQVAPPDEFAMLKKAQEQWRVTRIEDDGTIVGSTYQPTFREALLAVWRDRGRFQIVDRWGALFACGEALDPDDAKGMIDREEEISKAKPSKIELDPRFDPEKYPNRVETNGPDLWHANADCSVVLPEGMVPGTPSVDDCNGRLWPCGRCIK